MAFNFEKLRVWQDDIELTGDINNLIKTFPSEEKFFLATQIKRAADSIALNIAEGSTGQSKPEFVRFLGYGLRSGIEIISALYIAKRRKLIDEKHYDNSSSSVQGLSVHSKLQTK